MYHCNPLWYGRQGSRDLWRYLFNIVGTCWHLSKCPSLSHALAFWPTVGCCGGLLALDGPAPWLHAVNRTLEMTIQDMNRNIIMKHLPSCTKGSSLDSMSSDWLEAHIIIKYCQDRRSRKIPWPIMYIYIYLSYMYLCAY